MMYGNISSVLYKKHTRRFVGVWIFMRGNVDRMFVGCFRPRRQQGMTPLILQPLTTLPWPVTNDDIMKQIKCSFYVFI